MLHVQDFVVIGWPEMEIEKYEFVMEFELRWISNYTLSILWGSNYLCMPLVPDLGIRIMLCVTVLKGIT